MIFVSFFLLVGWNLEASPSISFLSLMDSAHQLLSFREKDLVREEHTLLKNSVLLFKVAFFIQFVDSSSMEDDGLWTAGCKGKG